MFSVGRPFPIPWSSFLPRVPLGALILAGAMGVLAYSDLGNVHGHQGAAQVAPKLAWRGNGPTRDQEADGVVALRPKSGAEGASVPEEPEQTSD
jgi:hypothetical protein